MFHGNWNNCKYFVEAFESVFFWNRASEVEDQPMTLRRLLVNFNVILLIR